MSIEILTHGCITCGRNGMAIAMVKRHYPDAKVIDTRKDPAQLERHVELLKHAGIVVSEYTAIVIEDNKVITPLRDWKHGRA